jgi:spermidine/putrescine-binding protein
MTSSNKELRDLLKTKLSRRRLMRDGANAAMFAAVASQAVRPTPARAEGVVNVLAWEGYDDPDIVRPFEEATGITVNVKTASSNANQLDQIRAGAIQFDVVNPDTVWTEKFAQSGLTMPLNRADFPHLEEMFEPFKNCTDCMDGGQLYGVTTRWGINGIVHWRDKLSEADAADANVIWDPQFADRISIIDWGELYLWQTGQWLGMEKPEEATGEALDEIVARLIEIKPNLRAIHTEVGAGKTDLANQDAWIVWGSSSNQTSIAMQEAGYDIALTIPEQGGAMWTESLQIVANSPNVDAAKAYLNYMTSAEALAKFAWGRQKIAVCNAKVADYITPEQFKILNMDKIDSWGERSKLGRAPVDEEAWRIAWQEFKAA